MPWQAACKEVYWEVAGDCVTVLDGIRTGVGMVPTWLTVKRSVSGAQLAHHFPVERSQVTCSESYPY